MLVNTVNNVSFFGRGQKEEKSENKYFKWLSQDEALDALKMTVGREEENGKYKFASLAAYSGGVIGLWGSLYSELKMLNNCKNVIIQRLSEPNANTAEEISKITKTFIKKSKNAGIVFIASIFAMLTGTMLQNINKIMAEKTAEERGFISQKEKNKITKRELLYSKTDDNYNAHVKDTDS